MNECAVACEPQVRRWVQDVDSTAINICVCGFQPRHCQYQSALSQHNRALHLEGHIQLVSKLSWGRKKESSRYYSSEWGHFRGRSRNLWKIILHHSSLIQYLWHVMLDYLCEIKIFCFILWFIQAEWKNCDISYNLIQKNHFCSLFSMMRVWFLFWLEPNKNGLSL